MSSNALRTVSIIVVVVVCCMPGFAAVRDVQIRSIDFSTGIVELHNFGTTDEPLDGWRFCTHDASVFRRYSSLSGLNGQTVEAGTSFFIHFNNDAPAGHPDRINQTTVGTFALPLDADAYGMGLYWTTPFTIGDNIADHLQWSIDGIHDTSADERSDEAEAGGVWTDQTAWIATAADTQLIRLKDASGGQILHGPDDYEALSPLLGSGSIGQSLMLDKAETILLLSWDPSCLSGDSDYEVYVGILGEPGLQTLTCTTGGLTTFAVDVAPIADDCFYLVVPTNGSDEGSYGQDSTGAERPPSDLACHPSAAAECPASTRHRAGPRVRGR